MTAKWCIALTGSLFLASHLIAQESTSIPRPSMRFGFFVGLDRCMPSVSLRPVSGPPSPTNSITDVSSLPDIGFSMGVLYEQALADRLAFRVMPSLNFFEAALEYDYTDGTSERRDWESTELALSIQAVGLATANGRGPSLAIGPTLKYDLEESAFSRTRFSIDGAAGYRMKVSNFYMVPELRYSYSLTDLARDEGSVSALVIDKLRGHVLSLALVFQD